MKECYCSECNWEGFWDDLINNCCPSCKSQDIFDIVLYFDNMEDDDDYDDDYDDDEEDDDFYDEDDDYEERDY